MKKRFFSPPVLAVTAAAAVLSGCAVVTPRGPAYYEPEPARVWVAPPPRVWVAPAPRVVVVPPGPPGYYRGRGHYHDRDDWRD
ncbi:hypothetical protein [Propionivibrio soli]|uniref:hypothetical protein n=1 Tax=Propionivibrio soli TaxID=2976531 RepID=UPI0021E98329|nr:hypothetical protein [Propionivibrio soli]